MMGLGDFAYLFLEQYDNLHGPNTEEYRKSEVELIRRTADKGELRLERVRKASLIRTIYHIILRL